MTTAIAFHRFIIVPTKKSRKKRKESGKIKNVKKLAGLRNTSLYFRTRVPWLLLCMVLSTYFLLMWFKGKFLHWPDYHGNYVHINQKWAPSLQVRTLWMVLIFTKTWVFLSNVTVLFLTWGFCNFSRVLLPYEEDNDNVVPSDPKPKPLFTGKGDEGMKLSFALV